MASELKVDKFTGVTTAGSIDVVGEGNSTTTNLQQGLAKSFFVFDQVNSNTIDDSFNIGSITDRGTGSLYGNFTNNKNSLHYTVSFSASIAASGSMNTTDNNRANVSSADTTARSSTNVNTVDTQAMVDSQNCQSVTHGDLA